MKRIALLMLAALLVLAAGCGDAAAPQQSTTGTTPSQSTTTTTTTTTEVTTTTTQTFKPSTIELKQVGDLQFYLYTPSNPTSHMPLIVYLHGSKNKTADVTALLTIEGLPKYLNEGYYGDVRAYIAIPKLDDSYQRWLNVDGKIMNMIDALQTECAVDPNKIALTGYSMGGTGAYQLQTAYPDTFACVAPVSGTIKPAQADLTALGKTKMWALVGTKDTVVNPNSSKQVMLALKDKGADARITEMKNATHYDMPALAYQNLELIQWLVSCGE